MNPAVLNTFRSAILGRLAFTILTQSAIMIRPATAEMSLVSTDAVVTQGQLPHGVAPHVYGLVVIDCCRFNVDVHVDAARDGGDLVHLRRDR